MEQPVSIHEKSASLPDVSLEDFDDGWPRYEEPVIMVHCTGAQETASVIPRGSVCLQIRAKTLFQALRKQDNLGGDQFTKNCPLFPQYDDTR